MSSIPLSRVAVVGRGRLGSALARAVGSPLAADDPAAVAVLLAVPDDAIEAVAARRAWRPGMLAVHHSGAHGLEVLDAAAAAGAEVACLHPLQTFPDRANGSVEGVACAVTAAASADRARQLARDLGMAPFDLAAEAKPLYHAAAVAASNYLTAVEYLAERLFAAAGVPGAPFWALAEASLRAARDLGPAASLTGPVVRGDAGTLARNRRAVREAAPDLEEAYVALARLALRAAVERSDAVDRTAVALVLDAEAVIPTAGRAA